MFIQSKGYREISFIPRSSKNGVQTPDLKGEKERAAILCEVKTKHVSDAFIEARDNSRVIRTNEILEAKLKPILKKTFGKAGSQLNSMPESSICEKYIYLIISYDNQKVDAGFLQELNPQTRQIFNSMNMDDLKLVIHNEN